LRDEYAAPAVISVLGIAVTVCGGADKANENVAFGGVFGIVGNALNGTRTVGQRVGRDADGFGKTVKRLHKYLRATQAALALQ
jgi:hypothetical protein